MTAAGAGCWLLLYLVLVWLQRQLLLLLLWGRCLIWCLQGWACLCLLLRLVWRLGT